MFSGKLTTALTTNSATPRYPLGYIYVEPASGTAGKGERHWIYVYNDEPATAFAEGVIVARDIGTVTYDVVVAPVNTDPSRVVGVAQHAITAGYYGFVLRQGIGEVIADTGDITADTGLIVGNAVAGRADDTGGVTAASFGFSTEAALATAKATSYFNCQG